MMFKVTPHRLLSCAHNAIDENEKERRGEQNKKQKYREKWPWAFELFGIAYYGPQFMAHRIDSFTKNSVGFCILLLLFLSHFVCFTSFCHIKIADKYVNTNEYDGSTEELWVDEERSAAIWFQDIAVCFVLTVCGCLFWVCLFRLKCQFYTDRYDENYFLWVWDTHEKNKHRSACNLQIELSQAHQ